MKNILILTLFAVNLNAQINNSAGPVSRSGRTPYNYADTVLSVKPTHILAYYKMNDASGTVMTEAKYGRNGQYRNGVLLNQDGIGDSLKSVTLDGTNDWINCDNTTIANAFNGSAGSMSIWVKTSPDTIIGNTKYIFSWTSVTNGNTVGILRATADSTIVVFYNAGGIQSLTQLNDYNGDWLHIGVIWDWINDRLDVSFNGIQPSPGWPGKVGVWGGILNHDKMFVGSVGSTPSQPIGGSFAHLAVWDTTLTAGEMYRLSGLNRVDNTTSADFTRVSTKSLYRASGTFDWIGRPFLLDNGDGTWLLMYKQSEQHHAPNPGNRVHLRFSDDEGLTWSKQDTLLDGITPVGGDLPFGMHVGGTDTGGKLLKCSNGDVLCHTYEDDLGSFQYRSTDGGATWVDEGQLLPSVQMVPDADATVADSIYFTVRNTTNPALETTDLWRSFDNGNTWALLSTIQNTIDGNETGIGYISGSTMMAIGKGSDLAHTYQYISNDFGQTWGSRIDITYPLGVVQKPVFRTLGGRIYLIGRDYYASDKFYTVVYVYDGVGWTYKFYPDTSSYIDGAYCDILRRADGTLYLMSYGGNYGTADLKEYIFTTQ